MGWSRAHNSTPRLFNYEQARNYHAKTKPIRGREVEYRPVGDRRSPAQIIKHSNDDISIRLYNTDIITFKADGVTMLVNWGGWTTTTTSSWIDALTPVHVGLAHSHAWTWEPHNRRGHLKMHSGGDNIFNRNTETMRWEFGNPVPVITHKANRKELNRVRRIYAPFFNYVKNIAKLTDTGRINLGWEDRKMGFLNTHHKTDDQKLAIAKGDDVEAHFHLLGYLCYMAPDYPIKKFDKIMITAHRDEVLTAIEHTGGGAVMDPYNWAF